MQKKVSFLFPFAFSIGWRSKFYQNLIKWLSFTINHQGNASYNSMTLGTNCMVVLQLTVYKWHNHFGKSFGSIYKKMNISHLCVCVCVLVAQLCLTLCDPHEPAMLLYPRNSSDKNTGVGSHSFLQGIFLTQGWNPGLVHCRRILHRLSQGSPSYDTAISLLDNSDTYVYLWI